MKNMGNNKRIKNILIAALACFVVIVVFSAIMTLVIKKPIDLYNIDQINTGMTDKEIDDLEKRIGESLKANTNYENRTGIKALVRPASFERKEKDGVVLYRFLMDIDEYKYTYEVSFGIVDGKGFYEPPTVVCPLPEQMKYSGVSCTGQRSAVDISTLGLKLPYYFRLESGEFVTVTSNYSSEGKGYLDVKVSSCGDVEVMRVARAEVENRIKSLGRDPDDYDIRVPEFCDGEAK